MAEKDRIVQVETASPLYPDSNRDTSVRPGRGPTYRTPRWVKIVGIIVLVLILLGGIIVLTGFGGDHGPGRHESSGDARSQTSLSSAIGVQALTGVDLVGCTSIFSLTQNGMQQLWS